MLSITITMLISIFYIVTPNNDGNIGDKEFHDPNRIMHETIYYQEYEKLKSPERTAVIYPIFTQNAYDWGSFHDFYLGRCDDCTSSEFTTGYEKIYASSGNAYTVLEFLGYTMLDDIQVDKNPNILRQFDKIILLHNEFVTKSEFDAIQNHPNVIYLYPNSLSSEISVDYQTNTLTLLRGPGYPTGDITNAFDWEFDNTPDLQNWDCLDWEFKQIDNGFMLNCYPEQIMTDNGFDILLKMKNL